MSKSKDYSTVEEVQMYINTSDYPDFSDSYVESASWPDGTPLTEEELDELNDDSQLVYELIIEQLY